jgi:HK97 family phage major capsid protein
LVPNELPEDSEVFAAMLGTMGGERIARKQNRDFTASLIAGATAVSAANAASLVSDDFANLIAGVGEQHLDGLDELVFMVSATSFGSILKLKDGSGNPLFVSGRVYGFRVVRNSHLAAPASGAVSVTFGRHQKFRIADVNTITVRRFGETAYAEKDEDLWEVVLRSDGALADCATVPVTKLVH